jgi:hypothetical protein
MAPRAIAGQGKAIIHRASPTLAILTSDATFFGGSMKNVDAIIAKYRGYHKEEKDEDMLDAANGMCAVLGLPLGDSFEDLVLMLSSRSEWYLEEGRNLAKLRDAIAAMWPEKRH